MEYLKVRWIHDLLTEPVLLMSELDSDRYELRKVELYADGRMGFASTDRESGGTILGEKPVPPVADIASDPQFIVEEFDDVGFEQAWCNATA